MSAAGSILHTARSGDAGFDLTLTSAPIAQRHVLQQAIAGHPSVVQRDSVGLPQESPHHRMALSRRYRRPGLDEINLGFAGRQRARHPVHRAIAALAPGDPLGVRVDARGRWELLDRSAAVVGRLARAFEPPGGMRCASASVRAVVTWSRDASEPEFQSGLKCDHWEVVVPELVFEPDA